MNQNTILILGANGQIGTALRAVYPEARTADSTDLDITAAKELDKYDWNGIKVVINAAAYTNVDGSESPEGRIAAWKTNAVAVSSLAETARQHDLTLVHISSDYVFDGTRTPHAEDEEFSPLSVYGASKAAGDIAATSAPKHYVLRTSWVIGEGKNFVRTMLGLGENGVSPTVVADQIGRLTFTTELAKAIKYLLDTPAPYGVYNLTNDGEPAAWADITREIFKLAGYDSTVTDTTTAEYFAGKDGIAPRPLNSVMDLSKIKAVGFEPRDWHDDLKNYIKKELAQ